MLRNVAVLYHPKREQAVVEARWLCEALEARGVHADLENAWDADVVAHICSGRDLIVALGGDGTIIRVARLAAVEGIPILGINLGRVGFLAAMTPDAMHTEIERIASGDFWLERRIMLDVEWNCGTASERFLSLNEVAVARGPAPRAIRVNIALDGNPFMTYTADGVLVATATGSTAYSLAAGGPILFPESRDFMLTPVAPHLHIGRSIIVPGDSAVTLTLDSARAAVMSVDGSEEEELVKGHAVTVRRSDTVALFARLDSEAYFYTAIADRLK